MVILSSSALVWRRSTELFIHFHVPPHDIIQWTHQPLKTMSVYYDQLAVSLGNNIGSARLILEEGSFTKVVPWLVLVDLLGFFVGVEGFGGDGGAFFDEVELVALVTLPDNVITSFACLL